MVDLLCCFVHAGCCLAHSVLCCVVLCARHHHHHHITLHPTPPTTPPPPPPQTFLPLDLRTKKTRAIRRRLTKEQVSQWVGW